MEKADIGRRIKKTRVERGLTLKAVEAAAGISATHVSEIERGKTSPTIGALMRIAGALGKEPAYFVEETELGEVSVVAGGVRVETPLEGGAGWVSQLTASIAGGRLQAVRVQLAPGRGRMHERHAHSGEEVALVVSGQVRFDVGEETFVLDAGDSIHYRASVAHHYYNPSSMQPAELIWVSSRRDNA